MLLALPLSAAIWAMTALAVVSFPGPRSISHDGDGQPYVDLSPDAGEDAIRYWAVDYDQLRPTVVYNCHWAISLCANARAYLGAGVNGPVEFHYDRSKERHDARRATICPTGWADANCVSAPYPLDFYTEKDGGARRYTWVPDRCDPKRCNYTRPGEFDQHGRLKLFRTGVIASCDEFPPATWIQGGVQGGTGAKAICAPFGSGIGSTGAWRTEQQWQSNIFGGIPSWTGSLAPNERKSDENIDRAFTIFTVSFKMVDEPGTPYAAWLEANGKKRYCAGPKGKGDCTSSKTAAELAIANSINQDMLDLAASSTRRRGLNETISYRSRAEKIPLAGMMMIGS